MGQALRKSKLVLEENGIVRSTVFPNAVREVRIMRGFNTLRAFDGKVDVNYTRLAKIERGEIFPTPEELMSLAEAMRVPVSKLLIDTNDPEFDREAWAREHIEANLEKRGGGLDAMKLGAALRVRRLAKGRATTDMKDFGLPAATVSRVENAERPLERWDAATQQGVAKVLGVRGAANLKKKVDEMFEKGDLDDMLCDLFSPSAIQERNNKRLKALLGQLPGKQVQKLLQVLDGRAGDEEVRPQRKVRAPRGEEKPLRTKARHGMVKRPQEEEPVKREPESESKHGYVSVLSGSVEKSGVFKVGPSSRRVALPAQVSPNAIAVEVIEPVLGPGLPRGTIVIADPAQKAAAGDVAVVLGKNGKEARLLSVIDGAAGLIGFSMAMGTTVSLENLPKGTVVAKMVATIAA